MNHHRKIMFEFTRHQSCHLFRSEFVIGSFASCDPYESQNKALDIALYVTFGLFFCIAQQQLVKFSGPHRFEGVTSSAYFKSH